MARLHIAEGLSLPLDATTQAIGIVAKRRVGKSYTARRFAEQLLKAGQQVVIADPKGDWWGIRSSADGKSAGYPVVILGGEHGDAPLEKDKGEIIAKMIVEERFSCLLDLSLFRKSEVAVFMADFLEAVYRLKAKEALRTPMMLIVDEADAIAPQKPQEGEERMLGAAEDIVRRGGQRGVGCMMITQRTAVLNKNVLTQCEMLVALRTISPQDLKAMQAWIDVHGSVEERDTLMASLPSLPQGDAWFWSPGWPTQDGIFKRVHVAAIETFDSGATPKSGEKRVEPKTLADVDIPALQKHIASTIERAKADDPKELRREIAHLRTELTKAQRAAQSPVNAGPPVVDQRAIDRAVATALKPYQSALSIGRQHLFAVVKSVKELPDRLESLALALNVNGNGHSVAVAAAEPERAPVVVSRPKPSATPRSPREDGGTAIGGTPQRILNALLFLETVGASPASRAAIAGLVGISWDTGTFRTYLSQLRQNEFIFDAADGAVGLTAAGRSHANDEGLPTTHAELHGAWRKKLGGTVAKMFDVLIDAYPESVERSDLGAAVDVSHETGTFRTYLSQMRAPGLIVDTSKTAVRASDALFPEGLS